MGERTTEPVGTVTRINDPEISPLRMTYQEFLEWSDEDTHAEWVNGEVIKFMPPKLPHQTLSHFLASLIGLFVEIFRLGRVLQAPFEIRLRNSLREPDVFFIANEHLDRLTEDRVNGAPDLIIEIVSKDSMQRDTEDKFDEYEAEGVLEYWIIDNRPRRRRAEFYHLDASGVYQSIAPDVNGIYQSEVSPGFWLRVEWLWQDRPEAWRALREILGPDGIARALRSE
jgi:Uma2 family endonuclease